MTKVNIRPGYLCRVENFIEKKALGAPFGNELAITTLFTALPLIRPASSRQSEELPTSGRVFDAA